MKAVCLATKSAVFARGIFMLVLLAFSTVFAAHAERNSSSPTSYVPAPFSLPELGHDIYGAVLTGNGLLGTATYRGDSPDAARIDIGRTDVYDHRAGGSSLYGQARLPLGYFSIDLGAPIVATAGTMVLYDGYAVASYTTTSGTVLIKTITLHDHDKIVIDIAHGSVTGSPRIAWAPAPSVSPRLARHATGELPPGYGPNPPARVYPGQHGSIAVQPMLAGGAYGLGYEVYEQKGHTVIVASTFYSQADADARSAIAKALDEFGPSQLGPAIAAHQQAWHAFYRKSSYRIPDPRLQAFYDMQLYKLGSAARPGGPAIDLQGPWTAATPWPGYWMNLNLQLTYSPLYAANHLELASTLVDMIDRHADQLIANAPAAYRHDSAALGRSSSPTLESPQTPVAGTGEDHPGSPSRSELGNLTWILFYYDKSYRYAMDPAVGNRLFDLLGRSVQYALHLLRRNADGRYELAVETYSPEYPGGMGLNTNYALSTLRWGLTTLIELDQSLARHDPRVAMWRDYLAHLIDYPRDATGFRIASDIPFAVSHRHYSHLLMIYPFHLVNWDQPESRAVIEQSIQTWRSKTEAFQGYSWSGLASMYASMGRGDAALEALHPLLDKRVSANTLYREAGPVIETPLSAMTSLQELVLQDWNGTVRVFPAVPSAWRDVSFENFRTAGAFLVSAWRRRGVNQRVRVFSEKGGVLSIKPGLGDRISCDGCQWTRDAAGVLRIDFRPGQQIMLRTAPTMTNRAL